jgi:hypothetical protein
MVILSYLCRSAHVSQNFRFYSDSDFRILLPPAMSGTSRTGTTQAARGFLPAKSWQHFLAGGYVNQRCLFPSGLAFFDRQLGFLMSLRRGCNPIFFERSKLNLAWSEVGWSPYQDRRVCCTTSWRRVTSSGEEFAVLIPDRTGLYCHNFPAIYTERSHPERCSKAWDQHSLASFQHGLSTSSHTETENRSLPNISTMDARTVSFT